jgi:hypothetical protein
MHENHVDEHVISIDAANPVNCTPTVHCSHTHGPGYGHEQVPHGDHVDYLVAAGCTIRTVIIAMTMALCSLPEGTEGPRRAD